MRILVYFELALLLPSLGATVTLYVRNSIPRSRVPVFLLSSFDPSDLRDPAVNFLKKFWS